MINELEHCDICVQYNVFDILTRRAFSSNTETFYSMNMQGIRKYYAIIREQQILKNMKKLEKQT